ncbi:MAG TPA: hypothetical protein VGR48_10255 [Terriglobales bacterium]|nr:hypothetical protein [Terriglobales bacterium]
MRGRLARTMWLLLALNVAAIGICPLAPAMQQSRVQKSHCRHEQLPPSGQHSCCVSFHHQPALVRVMAERSPALALSSLVLQVPVQTTPVATVAAGILAPSPPLPTSVLRI